MQVQKEFPEDGELMLSLGGCVRISSAKRGQRPLGGKDGKGTGQEAGRLQPRYGLWLQGPQGARWHRAFRHREECGFEAMGEFEARK